MNRITSVAVGCWAVTAFSLSGEVGGVEPAFRDVLRRHVTPFGDSPDSGRVIGIEYAVLLRRSGLEEAVDSEKHRFQPGDQIRVRIQPFSDAYIYAFFEEEQGRRCLLPTDKKLRRLAKRDQPVELPTDGAVFEFGAGFKGATLVLVASKDVDDSLATLCDAVCKKRDGTLTPEERTTRAELQVRNERALTVIRKRQSLAVAYHGRLSSQTLSSLWAKMEQRGAADAVLIEPPGSGQASTMAMFVTKADRPPKLIVGIPLKPAEDAVVSVPWPVRR
jgi:hypothetical protein